jgi:phosphatidylserine/phosphatidylglycerophosphate/cardiolipin synthase-like enzyme
MRDAALLLAVLLLLPVPALAQDNPPPEVHTYFSPPVGGEPTLERVILDAIAGARQSVRVQAYYFTSDPMATALINALQRNPNLVVEVIVYTANADNRGTEVPRLPRDGIAVWTDPAQPPLGLRPSPPHPGANNKVLIIDGETTVTGSYDLTAGANDSAENLVVIKHWATAEAFTRNFSSHKAHSDRVLP